MKDGMLTRNDIAGLEAGVTKYRALVGATRSAIKYADLQCTGCHLCGMYVGLNAKCTGCPIATTTGEEDCRGTPYYFKGSKDEESLATVKYVKLTASEATWWRIRKQLLLMAEFMQKILDDHMVKPSNSKSCTK